MVYVFLANGFEECEALVPVDILRRGGIKVSTVGVGGSVITGAHGIRVCCDIGENEIKESDMQAVILPGGMPGTLNLEKSAAVQNALDYAAERGLIIGAICAAPSVLGHKGLLKEKKATCFPGFEKDLIGAEFKEVPALRDGNIVTACGAGAAFDFGFLLLETLTGDKAAAEELKKAMLYKK